MGPMTAILPRPEGAPNPASAQVGAPQHRVLDCDVCVAGDGLVARALSHRLAALGRHVVRLSLPADDDLPLDPVLAPGFSLSAQGLVARLGLADAAELWHLSQEAAARGRDLLESLDLSPGPKGALLAARPDAVDRLKAEQDVIARIAPGASRYIGARDLEGLLGTTAFSAAIGLVPAMRVSGGEMEAAFARLGAEAGVQEMVPSGPIAFDLNGLRKYVDVGAVRIRAFEVILCGAAALRLGAPEAADDLATTHFAAGRMAMAQASARAALPPFAGRVDAFGGAGLAYQLDEEGLALAVETAWATRLSWSTARVLRHQARRLFAEGLAGPPTDGRGVEIMGARHGMPLVGTVSKGVWVAGALGRQPLSAHLMTADLIAGAVAEGDDRIALLRPFLAPEPKRAFVALRDLATYWHARLSARLAKAAGPVPDARGAEGCLPEPHLPEPHFPEHRPPEPRRPEPRAPESRVAEPRPGDPRPAEPRLAEPRYAEPRLAEPRVPEGESVQVGRGPRPVRTREGQRPAPRPAPGGARGAGGPPRPGARRGPSDAI